MSTSPSCDGVPAALSAGAIAEAVRSASTHRAAPDSELRSIVNIAVNAGLVDAASITVIRGSAPPMSLVTTHERAVRADDLQYQLGQGPCIDAATVSDVFVVEDLLSDCRWPQWSLKAALLPVGASISVHLYASDSLGSLNLYHWTPRAFTPLEIETAKIIAAHTSAMLAHVAVVENLTKAIDTRTLIGQAQGILMERFKLTSDQAFTYLAGYSQRHNTKLTVLAAELTDTGTLTDLAAMPPTIG